MKQFTSKSQKIGEWGEIEAVKFLEKQGYLIVSRNVSNKFGEIDIIAKRGKIHYFFEVKAGYIGGWVNPAENLTKEKLRKVFISVEHYCLINNIREYRISGIIVLLPRGETGSSRVEIIDL